MIFYVVHMSGSWKNFYKLIIMYFVRDFISHAFSYKKVGDVSLCIFWYNVTYETDIPNSN